MSGKNLGWQGEEWGGKIQKAKEVRLRSMSASGDPAVERTIARRVYSVFRQTLLGRGGGEGLKIEAVGPDLSRHAWR